MATAGTQISIPPLPPDTAGRWLDVVLEDTMMIRRWLNVNQQMNRSYARETPYVFRHSMAHRPSPVGAAYYYWIPGSELVLRCMYFRPRLQHQVLSVGFVGSITPEDALDLMIDQCVQYLRERSSRSAFAVVPKQADAPQILRLYNLAATYPRLRVTTEVESTAEQRWNIEFPELQGP